MDISTVVDLPETEFMGPVDRAWLEMDSHHNPMVMVGILEMSGIDRSRDVARVLVERLIRHPRFLQVADGSLQPAVWRADKALNLSYHVHVHRQVETPNHAALMRAIHRELAFPLDHNRPLWRVSLFRRRGGRLVALFRAHHAIADGVAMLRLLNRLDDQANGEQRRNAAPDAPPWHAGPLGSLIHRLESLNSVLLGAGQFVAEEFRHPEKLRGKLLEGEGIAAAILRVLRLPADNPTGLSGTLSGQRRVAWTSALPMGPVHDMAHRHGATVNDVFLCALATSFRRELLDRGANVTPEDTLRTAIPVNLRGEDDDSAGNHFGLVLLDLPIGETRRLVRLQRIMRQMRELKDSPEARAVLLSLGIAGQLPSAAEHRLIDLVADKSVAVVSNLPGAAQPLHIAGARIDNMTFFPPQAGHIGIGISLIGYAGQLTAGISADHSRIADPARFIRNLQIELRAMTRLR